MKQLRAVIPIAGPGRREAATGDEAGLRVVLGFEPQWFHEQCGVDFGEAWHKDEEYRRETLVGMREELRRRFPETTQWDDEAAMTWTVGGIYGVGIVPGLFGMKLRYAAHRWPEVLAGTAEREEYGRGRIEENAFAREVLEQVRRMGKRGPVAGDLNWQGVLNVAFHLRGERIFLDMADDPEGVERLFEEIAAAIVEFGQAVQGEQRRSGYGIDWMAVSNCTVNMISPRMYVRMLRGHDARIGEGFERFGVHTCNWNVTPYLEGLSGLERMGYLDMGLESDLGAARRRLPEARLGVMYAPWRLKEVSGEELQADLRRVWKEAAPVDLVVADLPLEVGDERVRELLKVARELCGASS